MSRFNTLRRAAVTSTAAVILFAAPGDILAQEAGVDRTAAARELFQQGLALLDAEDWAEAADRFQRALALRPSPQIAYNLTTALIPLGRFVRATEILRQLSLDPTAPPEVRDAAEARRQELLPRLAHLTIRLPEELAGAQVFLDERPYDAVLVGVAAPIDPGGHVVVARRDGVVAARQELTIEEGGRLELTLTP